MSDFPRTCSNVLVVDDDEDLLVILEEILTSEFNIYKAKNGKEAVDILNFKKIDCVLTDYRMPEMNGLELIDYLFKNRPSVPIILLTGNGGDADVIKALTDGVFDYLDKPFHAPVLINRIKHALLLPRLESLVFDMAKLEFPEFNVKDYRAMKVDDKIVYLEGIEAILRLRLQTKILGRAK